MLSVAMWIPHPGSGGPPPSGQPLLAAALWFAHSDGEEEAGRLWLSSTPRQVTFFLTCFLSDPMFGISGCKWVLLCHRKSESPNLLCPGVWWWGTSLVMKKTCFQTLWGHGQPWYSYPWLKVLTTCFLLQDLDCCCCHIMFKMVPALLREVPGSQEGFGDCW